LVVRPVPLVMFSGSMGVMAVKMMPGPHQNWG